MSTGCWMADRKGGNGMIYKTLGKTGLRVSAMSLGTWAIGGAGWGHTDEKACQEAVAVMLDAGVNLIDTAPAYNGGEAEKFLGKILKGKRESLVYVTKTGTQYVNGTYIRDNSAKAVRRQCEESLRYLDTDHIDVYLVHWPDQNVPMEETFTELNRLQEEGKIRHIGVSNFSLDQIKEASCFSEITVAQDQYSMVHEKEKEKLCGIHELGIGTMTYGSMGAGILSGKYREKPVFDAGDMRTTFYSFFEEPVFTRIQELLKEMDEIAKRHNGVSLSQIALNWSISKPYVDTAIVGVRSAAHAQENSSAAGWKLAPEELNLLDDAVGKLQVLMKG